MKPGYKTTEFWGKATVQLIGLIYMSGILEQTATTWDNKIVGFAALVLAELGYGVARGLAKKAGK